MASDEIGGCCDLNHKMGVLKGERDTWAAAAHGRRSAIGAMGRRSSGKGAQRCRPITPIRSATTKDTKTDQRIYEDV